MSRVVRPPFPIRFVARSPIPTLSQSPPAETAVFLDLGIPDNVTIAGGLGWNIDVVCLPDMQRTMAGHRIRAVVTVESRHDDNFEAIVQHFPLFPGTKLLDVMRTISGRALLILVRHCRGAGGWGGWRAGLGRLGVGAGVHCTATNVVGSHSPHSLQAQLNERVCV